MSEDKAVFRACGNCGCRIDGFCVSEVAKENNCAMDPDLPCWIPEGFAKVVAQCTEKPDTIKKNNHETPDFFQQKLREQRDGKRGKALRKAMEIINGERQDSYGNPENSFALIAKYWNTYLIEIQKAVLVKYGFDPKDYDLVDMLESRNVAEMMTLFKIARMTGQKTTPDNYADAAGYIGIAGDLI
jgi:hypothetical protein